MAATPAPADASSAAPTPRQPNILYIMADQLAAPLLKIHDPKSLIKTPHLDALAEQAVVFDSAYCPSPLCAPSRMSMITGQLPSKIGAWDNAAPISLDTPTYAHYLRKAGYETVLAGKMHFIGDQLHGYERRLTPDIYPGDFGWAVNWDEPETSLEWYHNASSILQAGPCVRSNQLDYDEEVMYRSSQFLYDHLSLTHPHDPYTIEQKYWDMYEDVDIRLPTVNIPKDRQDAHSERLLKVCDLWDQDIPEECVRRARRAYYGAVSYVDDCIGRILKVLQECRLDDNTIIVFSGDHGDMLGERGLWYKMSWFEASARVPMLVHCPRLFAPGRVAQNVSTLDILPTLVDLAGSRLEADLSIDGHSLFPLLVGGSKEDADQVFGEYCGEGTIAPMMMIRRGPWKFIICSPDADQLYNLAEDPLELINLARGKGATPTALAALDAFRAEAARKWDLGGIRATVLRSQRQRRLCWQALSRGLKTSWDWKGEDDGREKYIRSHMPLDDLELRARYPPVDARGREMARGTIAPGGQAGALGE